MVQRAATIFHPLTLYSYLMQLADILSSVTNYIHKYSSIQLSTIHDESLTYLTFSRKHFCLHIDSSRSSFVSATDLSWSLF